MPGGPQHQGRDAGGLQQSGVRPVGSARQDRLAAQHAAGLGLRQPRDARIAVHLERLAQKRQLRPPPEAGCAAGGLVQDGLHLPLDLRARLAGQGAPLVAGAARGRGHEELLAPVDADHLRDPVARQRVGRTLVQLALEALDPAEHAAHVRHRVHAALRLRGVRGHPLGVQLEDREAAVRQVELEVAGLGDDGGVGAEALQHRLGAHRSVLLVGDGGQQHVTAQLGGGRGLERAHRGGEPGLHVERAATVEPAVLQARLEGRVHPLHADGVEVRVEQQAGAAAAAARGQHHAGPARHRLEPGDLQPPLLAPRRDHLRDGALAGRAVHQRRVDRIGADQAPQQRQAACRPARWVALRRGHARAYPTRPGRRASRRRASAYRGRRRSRRPDV